MPGPLFLALLFFFFPSIHSLIPGTVPTSKSPDTLPIDPTIPDIIPTNLSALPSQIFVTDGDLRHLPVILNCVASLLRLNVRREEIYVMTYAADITLQLNRIGVQTLYRPDWLEEGNELCLRFHCPNKNGKALMDLVMYMKQRLFIEMAHRGVRIMIFDSDVVFQSNPQVVMDADKEPLLYGEDTDAVVYGAATVAVGAKWGWTNHAARKGRFGVNGSPGAFLNSKMLLPLWTANMQYGLALWEKCVWGWGQKGLGALLFQLGLRWKAVQDPESGKPNWSVYHSEWVEPSPQPDLIEAFNTSEQLYEQLVSRDPRPMNIVALDTDRPLMPAHHYHDPGGPSAKEKIIRRAGWWFLRKDWQRMLDLNATFTELFVE